MESRSISGVTSTCRNPCRSPVEHSKEYMVYLCSQNLLLFLLKRNTKFLEIYKRSLIFSSACIYVDTLSLGLPKLYFKGSHVKYLTFDIFLDKMSTIVSILTFMTRTYFMLI